VRELAAAGAIHSWQSEMPPNNTYF